MFLGKKFNREKLTESALRFGQCSSLSSYYSKNKTLLNKSGVVIVIISILALIITIVCFFGQDLIWIQFIPHTKAKMQIISEIPFEYVSKIKTQVLKDQRRMLVAPVYKIEMSPYDTFERNIYRLDELLDAFLGQDSSSTAYLDEFKKFVRNFSEKHRIDIRWGDVNTLFQGVDEYGRTGILVEGLSIVKNILGEGIFDQSLIDRKSEEYFLNIEIEGKISRSHSRTEDEANRHLKLCLSSIEAPADVIQAVFRILKMGVRSNIVFDDAATSQKITRILQETPDVMVKIPINTVLIEAGAMVTDEDNERLQAYRTTLQNAHISLLHASNNNLVGRFLVSFLVLLLIYLFFCTSRGDLKALTRKEFSLVVVLLLLNLLIFRLIIYIFELQIFAKITSSIWLDEEGATISLFNPVHLLPYVMPLTFSCLLGTLLLRTYIGMLLGIVSSIFCCLMLSQSVEFLIISFFVVFVSVYFVRHSHIRTQVIRSGTFGGLVFALSAIGFSFSGHVPRNTYLWGAFLSFLNGVFVSMITLIILPFFENIFKCCTNIRLIELTDYRNSLLTKLQILAPGTYHHSLMVANLSEQAAISVRANPFLCRTLALYHDIGKLIKPEYFTENQGSHKNPHDEKTPFMSALIIKSHVKEGLAMAKAEGMPPRIIDGIVEHHGTSIIRYFYSKALKQQEEIQISSDPSASHQGEIERSAFKYDGPRPRSKETLILSLADSIEAASRSLYNPTPQSIGVLIDSVIEGKVKENQFDECLVTFHEVDALRHSFYFTLLNMLHSRISYDEVKV